MQRNPPSHSIEDFQVFPFSGLRTIVVGSNPYYVAFTQDSSFAYVANYPAGDVSVIDTASQTVVQTISGVAGSLGVAVMGTVKVSTVAGGYVGDNGPATSAALSPFNTVQDKAGNYYVTDRYAHRIRKITSSGTITTIAGTFADTTARTFPPNRRCSVTLRG